jgi:chromosome segregation ATPase
MVNRLDQLRQSLGHDVTAQSSALAEGMEKALAEVGTTDLSDALASVADLEARILAAEEEAARQLERVAERTSATGSMSMALLQATGERVLGSLAGLGTQLSQLRSDLAVTQQEIVELRTDVDDLRMVAARPPAAPPPPPQPPTEESAPAPAKRPRSCAESSA